MAYDATGRLYRTTLNGSQTNFLYDGDELVAEYNSSGNILRRYVHGIAVDDPQVMYIGSGTNDKRYLLANEQGSILALTNNSEALTTTHQYGPYGEPMDSSTERFRYTGQLLLTGTELYYYKARVYHPKLGRFMQTDPIGYDDGMNWYAYVGNDPVNMIDPSGKVAHIVVRVVVGCAMKSACRKEVAKKAKEIWKGKDKRNSQKQKKFREKVIENNQKQNNGNTKCEKCGTDVRTSTEKVGKGDKVPKDRAEAHHKDGNRNNNNADNNGELLCKECHIKEHKGKK